MRIQVNVNGESREADVEPRLLLVHFIRDSLGLTGEHGLQCGFCTPGMIMTATALLERTPRPSEDEIREAISGNLCRCTGYQYIIKSIEWAARQGAPTRVEVMP